jgi:hypothetical protein
LAAKRFALDCEIVPASRATVKTRLSHRPLRGCDGLKDHGALSLCGGHQIHIWICEHRTTTMRVIIGFAFRDGSPFIAVLSPILGQRHLLQLGWRGALVPILQLSGHEH